MAVTVNGKCITEMKYHELQKIAKSIGIKANVKIDKLLQQLTDYYSQKENICHEPVSPKQMPEISKETSDDDKSTGKMKRLPPKKAKKRGRKPAKESEERLNMTDKADSSFQSEPTAKKQKTSPTTSSQRSSAKHTPVSKSTKSAVPSSGTKRRNSSSATKRRQSKKNEVLMPQLKSVLSRKGSPWTKDASGTKHRQADKTSILTPQKKSVLFGKGSPLTKDASGSKHRKSEKKSVPTPQVKSVLHKNSLSPQKRKRSHSKSRKEDSVQGTSSGKPSSKRCRRSTFDKTPEKLAGVGGLLDSMKEHMNSTERKESLMTAITSKVKAKSKNGTPKTNAAENSQTHIPRFAAFVEKNRDGNKKPVTPGNKDWKKIHNKEFSKFDSIDVYLEKKKKRNQVITASVKKARKLLDETKAAVSRLQSLKTPNNENKAKSRQNENRNSNANMCKSLKVTPFKPVVLKTKSMNLNFNKTPQKSGQIKCDNERVMRTQEKAASVKPASVTSRKSLGTLPQTSTTGTPFTFTATLNKTGYGLNMSMASSKKPAFDLKASLSRPVTWKAHKGKLKPMADLNEPQYLYSQIGSKTPKIRTRDDRRKAAVTHRAEKKQQSQMKRRGIVS